MNKKSCVVFFIVFFSCQVIIDLLHSVTVFPFLHYGMYSERFDKPHDVEVFEITADGKVLKAGDFRMHVWDMIHSPLSAMQKQVSTGDFSFDRKKMQEGMQFTGLGSLYGIIEPNLRNDTALTIRFTAWYKTYLEKLLSHPVLTLEVSRIFYNYENGRYVELKKEKWLNV